MPKVKCLGCQTISMRDGEPTASPELFRIVCSTCGGKRIARLEREPTAEREPFVPGDYPNELAAKPEVDLVAEARRIFDVADPTPDQVAAVVDDVSGMATAEPEEKDPIETAYREWLRTGDGATVARAIRDRALALARRGWKHYGIAALFEAARFDHDLDIGPDVDGWRLNNNHRSRLARDLMARYPEELGGFFETRELRSER